MSQDDVRLSPELIAQLNKLASRLTAQGEYEACDLIDTVVERVSAMPQRELRIGDFILRHSPNGIWIGRTDGESGEFATEHVERVIAQFYRENF